MKTTVPVPLFDIQFGEGSTADYLLWAQLLLGRARRWAKNRWETTWRFYSSRGVAILNSPRGFRIGGQTFARARVTVRVHDEQTLEVLSLEGLNN